MALTCIKWARGIGCAIALALGSAAVFAQGSDADVLAAKDAAQKGQWKVFESLRPRLAGHPLEIYLAYWELAGATQRFDPGAVRAFLDRAAGTPLAEPVRAEWLRGLGAAGSWELFRAEAPKLATDDAEIACYVLQERLARNDPEVLAEARVLYLSGRDTPGACDPAYAALAAARRVGVAETWERTRKLLAANSLRGAKRAASLLPPREGFNEKTLDRAAADPSAFLAREKSPILNRASRELAIFAIGRLARAKPDEAAERLALLASRLGRDDARFAWALVAHQAALVHSPRALEWYREAGDTPLEEAQAAWKARAALRAGEWKTVLAAIQQLPPEEARDATWRYWRARALRTQGEAEAAEGLMRGVARERGFYGLLAAEELGIVSVPDWSGWRPAPADIERLRARPGIQRALILYRIGLDPEALREWALAVRNLEDRDLLAAAEVARQSELSDRAIHTADRTAQLHDFSQRYPIPYREALAAAARQWNLDEALLYAIIRQESRFRVEARSPVGATGLMQLMPATARWVATQIRLAPFHPDMLRQPEVNVNMGTWYFGHVLTDLGHPLLAAAAYNAGPGRARRWRGNEPLDGAIYAETIPFNETRDYVKKVFANAWYYRHRLTGQPASLRQLLGTVPARPAAPERPAVAAVLP